MKRNQVTILDLARQLGISKSTVSRALQGMKQISPETRKLVTDLAHATGYQPNLMALGLKNQRSNIIGVIVPDIELPFYASLTSSVQQYALQHNYHTVICQSKECFSVETDVLQTLWGLQVAGILMIHSKETRDFAHVQQVIGRKIPVILVDRSVTDFDIPQVENDHYAGGFAIGQHLAQVGCKNIAIIGGPRHLKLSNLRIEGCVAGAGSAGVPIKASYIYQGDFNREKTLSILDEILKSDTRPDGIFCVQDRGAFEVLKQLEFRNIAVPDEIAVAGFGNEMMSKYVVPSLTTVEQNPARLGELATATLISQIMDNVTAPIQQQLIRPELIVRDSTRRTITRQTKVNHLKAERVVCTAATVVDSFKSLYGAAPACTVQAPAVITLGGDYTDYHDGILVGAGIDQQVYCCLSESPDSLCHIQAVETNEHLCLPLDQLRFSAVSWSPFIQSVLNAFQHAQIPIRPFQLAFGGNIAAVAGPPTASLQGGLLYGLNALFNLGLTKSALVRLALQAENELRETPTGIINKYACMLGKTGGFMKVDCLSMDFEYLDFPYETYSLIMCDTGVHYGSARAEMNTRISETQEVLDCLKGKFPAVQSFRDITPGMLVAARGRMRPDIFRHANYIVREIANVQEAVGVLRQGLVIPFGETLYATQKGLQEDDRFSCPEVNFLIGFARRQKECIGAKMIGEGFGSSTLHIVNRSGLANFMRKLETAYLKKYGVRPGLQAVSLSKGVCLIS
ncbi:substrate-binding domain-containing protein [Paraflavitalea sp. CAU 1676]|uniref:substrate-binding domain-containing protein n=1 Tax=Paraflavitalea sp. CAU 1676 TaxID=3032598 RepID=UPI0023DB0915|nr:substrate-binding domain-containing protein [Paraflavitalea sp. CAU 1676]MDF2193490.1 substrate-binding domain-containing protein [Paraflavitalea sp. CAU 1676]